MRSPIAKSAAALYLGTAVFATVVASPWHPVSTAPGESEPLTAKDAGAHYGEAAGAVLVCSGLRITPAVAELRARYQGADLAEFDAQAAKILGAWRDTLTCQHADSPSDCKLSQQLSCRQALQDIGPSGTKVRGLVEPIE
ncbi:MAG: hypothetical protein K8F92_20245 [Hyphomicrobium sp.]|uniref:hypothetical protein n=1 Tax=Hyphomicrobium sp. TaxID=82 RepID=UPI00132B7956|nr:hypothetical protein [Hyphomicrobium sp.]KAB2942782.1 MAG: hypothetical protein F9K20_04710 [Hyphomicrobium sp.]MBZ0211965.1 hypothetical protein [Hyphomicrobium sp.]